MKFWPLSPAGSFLFLSCLYLLGTGVPRGQGYGIFLGIFFLAYLSVALVRIILFSLSLEKDRIQWRLLWNYAAAEGRRKNLILTVPVRAPLGTRYLFLCRGDLHSENETLYSFASQVPFVLEAREELVLPLPGEVRCKGRFYASDLFGLVRLPLTEREFRTVIYHPPLLSDRFIPPPASAEKDEENIKNSPSQPEKILMRDYQPGDLVRDINWKASGKFTSIYTRIAPDLERSVTRMALLVRNEGTLNLEEPLGSALLLGLKALSETMIHTIRRDYPECLLEVIVGGGAYILEDEEKGQECLYRISMLGRRDFAPPEILPDGGIVCTTIGDRNIPLLRELYGDRVFVCGCGTEEGEREGPVYSLFRGNALPRGERLRRLLPSFPPEKKLPRLLASRPDQTCSLKTGVSL